MPEPQNRVEITVLMPTYCHEHYISKALDSILAQKVMVSYEILVGDDASQDATADLIRDYAERFPDVIHPVFHNKNRGAGRNIWNLLQRARGRYIAMLEGDDFWLDCHKLQKQWEFLEAHPEYSGCCGKCLVTDASGEPDYTRTPQFVWNKKEFTMDDFLAKWHLPGQIGTLMYRNFFAEMRPEEYAILYTAHRNVGDKTLMLFLLSHGPVYCSNDVLSCYRFVSQPDGHNYFSLHYANPYRHYDMFLYPCRLETWAKKHLGLRHHLGARKEVRFRRFVEELVREPSFQRLGYMVEMIVRSHEPAKYCWCVLTTLIEMER